MTPQVKLSHSLQVSQFDVIIRKLLEMIATFSQRVALRS